MAGSFEKAAALVRRVGRWLVHPFWREPDFYIGGKDDPYLLRWWVIPRNPFFNVYLHKFLRDDDDRALHDHPWVSVSIVLKGGYIEHLPFPMKGAPLFWPDGQLFTQWNVRRAGQVIFRRAKHAHRIQLLRSGGEAVPAWTLFITGPRVREWGFHCPQGWRHWRDFTSETDSGNVGKGCD